MGKEGAPKGKADLNADGSDDIFERYLAETVDLRYAPAITIEKDGRGPVYRTLDGTQVFPLWELAEIMGLDAGELRELLDTGILRGIQVGEWFVRKDEVERYKAAL